MICTSY